MIDDFSTLQNEGAYARMVVMKPLGTGYVADTAINGTGLVYWLHATTADAFSSTFAKSIVGQYNQFMVVGTMNYRSPDFDVTLTRIAP